jgi:hypothetical protein
VSYVTACCVCDGIGCGVCERERGEEGREGRRGVREEQRRGRTRGNKRKRSKIE